MFEMPEAVMSNMGDVRGGPRILEFNTDIFTIALNTRKNL